MYRITKHHATLQNVCPTDAGRYAINGVQFEPLNESAGVAVATDGRRLVAMTCERIEGQEAHPVILPRTALAEVARFDPKRGPGELTNGDPKKLTLRHGNSALDVEPVDGTFPRWREVLPQTANLWITFDAALLEGVLKTIPKKSDGKRLVSFGLADWTRPALLFANGPEQAVLGVLMPVSLGCDTLPDGGHEAAFRATYQRCTGAALPERTEQQATTADPSGSGPSDPPSDDGGGGGSSGDSEDPQPDPNSDASAPQTAPVPEGQQPEPGTDAPNAPVAHCGKALARVIDETGILRHTGLVKVVDAEGKPLTDQQPTATAVPLWTDDQGTGRPMKDVLTDLNTLLDGAGLQRLGLNDFDARTWPHWRDYQWIACYVVSDRGGDHGAYWIHVALTSLDGQHRLMFLGKAFGLDLARRTAAAVGVALNV